MPANDSGWSSRFFDSIRGKIIVLLRHEVRTVSELAAALHLTNNAVRAQLATLERNGLIRRGGERRGFRKPHYSYELTSEAEELFPKRYGLLLNRVLAELKKRCGSEKVTAALRAIGRGIATSHKARADAPVSQRFEQILKVFHEFGGHARIELSDGTTLIRGTTCPLAAITGDHTEICQMMQTLISEIAGTPVREKCQREPVPKCCFEVILPPKKSKRVRLR
jgi:predicted ArsR family transcriptional regulator